jgi:membrane protein DedA with SNARE-associated domain
MNHHIFELLRGALVHYGYWAVAACLLLENVGLPLPGESVLLLSSFLAYSERDLQLGWIIVVATAATAVGGEGGYLVGKHGGRPLLEKFGKFFHVSDAELERGEKLFARYGALTVLIARFVFGMRVIAGPMAGALHMSRKSFTIFNLVGAGLWVSAICCVGYFFGGQKKILMHFMQRFDLLLGAAFVVIVVVLWWRNRKARRLAAGA